jgi:protein-tyrosine kinase
MSIIERAASRLEHKQPTAAPVAQAQETPSAAEPAAQASDTIAAQPAVDVAAPAAAHAAAPAPAAVEPLTNATPTATAATATAAAATTAVASDSAPARPARTTKRVELDLKRMQEIGLVTAAGGRTMLVEDFRIIKRPLIRRAFTPRGPEENPGNLIMVTSSLPGEGKTFCSINLAMSIAMELDHTVLLVDADVARPSVLRTLGLSAQKGLMDLLLDDKADMADVMLRTNVDTLTILPAGTSSPRATELLASQTMTNFVHEIASRYPDRIVIFDSPPLLLTSEAHVLASHMGQIVVVVEAERTTQHAVKESLRQLEGLPNVNLIYNKTREFPGTETYDYHYG